MKRTLFTRHGEAFDICCGRIDRKISLRDSIYKASFKSSLSEKYAALDKAIGHDQYLWCFCGKSPFDFELGKEIEWEINIEESNIIGFVKNKDWDYFLNDGQNNFGNIEKQWPSNDDDWSALIPFPVNKSDIVAKYKLERKFSNCSVKARIPIPF
jgi:hypothetical protein